MYYLDLSRITTTKHMRSESFVRTILIAVTGYAVGKVSEISVRLIKDKLKPLKQNSLPNKTFNVNGIYSSEDGFELTFGDTFRILEQGDKYVLIRKDGGGNETHKIPVTVLNSLIENQ